MLRDLKKNRRFDRKPIVHRGLRASIGFSAILLIASLSYAQVDRSGLSGTVTDSSGRLLAQAHITTVQNSTHLRRETVSNSNGSYNIPELPVGVYTVTFDHPGFKTLTFVDVEQVIGRTRTLDASMQVAGGEERVHVAASSEQMDNNTDALGGRIEKAQAQKLPLNGRNWATLTALVPGAVDTGGSNQRSVRFAGRGRDDDNFTYDGIDATNIINQPQQPYVRLSIPLDTIEEFRVDSMLAPAEAAATGGPQLAVTSPSGTNQWHGNAFEYLRNNYFDAPPAGACDNRAAAAFSPESVRRFGRRSHRARQDVFLPRLRRIPAELGISAKRLRAQHAHSEPEFWLIRRCCSRS